ncbi:MAG: 3-hydroxyacyl-ACP dehydratase FabZ family protein [Candidatus Binatia bacterium]
MKPGADGVVLLPEEVLARIPQQNPFRFVDEIVTIDEEEVVARYRWREDADFYRGHFPGNPVTPGVLLVESMAQAGVVALGLYLVARDPSLRPGGSTLIAFTDANVEFSGIVRPGERVEIRGRKQFLRRGKIRAEVEMRREDGSLVCSGVISGMAVAP